MADVIQDVAAFDTMRPDLDSEHLGEWVVLHDRELAGLLGVGWTASSG
jgi:hypothetical protein